MKLTLLETSGTIKNGMLSNGEVCGYDVAGLPAGEHAKIAYLNQTWRLLRWNDEWHGNWSGRYATPEVALEALREEMLMPA